MPGEEETEDDLGLYSKKDKFAGFATSIGDDDEEEEAPRRSTIEAPKSMLNEIPRGDPADDDPLAGTKRQTIAEREAGTYQGQRRNQLLSPERGDAFSESTPNPSHRSYKEVMEQHNLQREEEEVLAKIAKKQEEAKAAGTELQVNPERKRRRWDVGADDPAKKQKSEWDVETPMPGAGASRWDTPTPGRGEFTPGGITPGGVTPGGITPGGITPGGVTPGGITPGGVTPGGVTPGGVTPGGVTPGGVTPGGVTPGGVTPGGVTPGGMTPGGMTPGGDTPGGITPGRIRNRWDETPTPGRALGGDTPGRSAWDQTPRAMGGETPTPKRGGKSRWDETPATMMGSTPTAGAASQSTPVADFIVNTPSAGMGGGGPAIPMTPEQAQSLRWEREIEERNRPLTDEDLDSMFPPEGYKVLEPPATYVPIRTPARKLMSTPTPGMEGFAIGMEQGRDSYDVQQTPAGNLPFVKPEDVQYFGALLQDVEEDELSAEEQRERKIMKLLLKVKNGTPPQRKQALRQLTDKAREFGAGPLFNQILPLLMSPTLEDQERHLLVKVIDRVLYKLDDLVRPYVHKILVVIEPLLIDEDYYARVEGREIISNLAKAAGLATMIATMRPDIDNVDEYVRNTTARAFSVVASALGIPALLPFLKAVCQSKKSWQARHTGIKIVQQIAILMGCAILPHLKQLVDITAHGLTDENQKVRTITALSIAAMAEAATPYGIESFDNVLKPLWKGICQHRGKGLAAFLKAIGYIIPLMDSEYANYYTREVMLVLIREFQTADEEMKKIVLKVVKQCVATDGVAPDYVRNEILPEYFRCFWVRRMALDRRNYRQLVDTTEELANKVGVSEIASRIVDDLKDESEPYRKMVMETVEKVITNLGAADVDPRLEERLIDGILYAFQEQSGDDSMVILNGFGVVVNSLGDRAKPYLPQICGTIKWRLNNKSSKVRQQAADLIARVAIVMKTCNEEQLMAHLGVVLYEYLGEEYPEVLGSILAALKSIVNCIGMTKMTPPIKDLLPRLTPILKNRHEKVQENCIDLVGRIADRGAEFVSAREWMRICFELLEMLKAHKKAIRRATVNTFGYIAKAIGPQDVLATLLNNLKVQERQNRVCTTVAIAIVAETCSPFTVLPGLMNEYRVPELNVQNGVLKSLSFLFEYIGEMGKDYIYAVTPLLMDALMDRDLVHRQTASTTVKHLALGVAGLSCEDALQHLMNFVWPNIFETSPHVINAVMEAIEGMRVALGPTRVMQYTLQGLFHPARKVREVYWKIYNNLYIGSQDSLTPAYPRIDDDDTNTYQRPELDLFL